MSTHIRNIIKFCLPFALGISILWWMYRETDWTEFIQCITKEMNWGWMMVSLAFGILPGMVRGWRWRMTLTPLGERARSRTCIHAVFLSYASSLVIPRIGEVTRCGTLKKYDGVSFTKALGTVVTERIVDSLVILLLTGLAICLQIPTLFHFLETTGTDLQSILLKFTGTGYLVTLLCLIAIAGLAVFLLYRFSIFKKGKDAMNNLLTGVMSLKKVKNIPLYLVYSVAIWLAYFLHFYTAFFCFDFTAGIDPMAAFFIFCVGTFAVLVPTPNGAGPWHFAVKTMLVIYGVAEPKAILFALTVHTIQTFEVVLLGAYSWADLTFRKERQQLRNPIKN